MKQSFYSVAFLLFILLVFSSSLAASLRELKEGEGDQAKLNEITSDIPMEDGESMNLMGMEVCDKGDEACLKRRMISEAHLDYIYTQHHKH